jgi:RNA 3'-terminal phosphate cyclase
MRQTLCGFFESLTFLDRVNPKGWSQMTSPVVIDCSVGEGGGGMLRCALPLAVITRQAVTLKNFRSWRTDASRGVGWIHHRFIQAVCELSDSSCDYEWGATQIAFWPGELSARPIRLDLDDPAWTFATDAITGRRDYRGATDRIDQNIDNVDGRGVRGHAIGGFLVGLLPLLLEAPGTRIEAVGGTETLAAPFVDAVLNALYPLASKLTGIGLDGEVFARGCMGRGGGTVAVASHRAVDTVSQRLDLPPLPTTTRIEMKAVVYVFGFASWRESTLQRLAGALSMMKDRLGLSLAVRDVSIPYGSDRWALLVEISAGTYVRDVGFTSEEGISDSDLERALHDRVSAEIAAARLLSRFLVEQLLPIVALRFQQATIATESITPHMRSAAYVVGCLTDKSVELIDEPVPLVKMGMGGPGQ